MDKVISRENEEDTIIDGLWAAGETACVSIHGANRLGANSLLELVVFGKAIADQIDCLTRPGERHEDLSTVRILLFVVYFMKSTRVEYCKSIAKVFQNISQLFGQILDSRILNNHQPFFLVNFSYSFFVFILIEGKK